MTRRDVSVILPVHNAGPGLDEGLDRLAATDLVGCEIILVDDGSSDGSGERLERFAADRDDTTVVILPRNVGVAAARNDAVRRAVGEYLWFVDWDDEWSPAIVRTMLVRARSSGADVVVCRAVRDGSRSEVLDGLPDPVELTGPEAFDLVLRGRLRGYLWSKLIRRDALPDDPFPLQRSQSDFCGVVPVLAASALVATEPAVLYRHLTRAGSITNSADPDLSNLYRCSDAVHRTAAVLPSDPGRAKLLDHYDQCFLHLAVANTALRLGSSPEFISGNVRRAARDLRVRKIASSARIDLPAAVRCLLVKIAGVRYAAVYRTAVGLRSKWVRPAGGGPG